jgi:Cdc6-like AAA superfamily ATPase
VKTENNSENRKALTSFSQGFNSATSTMRTILEENECTKVHVTSFSTSEIYNHYEEAYMYCLTMKVIDTVHGERNF